MAHHELKTDPDVFQASFDGKKNYEIRWNDRGYQVGDTLILRETTYSYADRMTLPNPKPLIYTGRELNETINHVLDGGKYGLQQGWVILNLDV